MKNIVIQITDKSGSHLQRVNVGGSGLSIGRGWNSDVILQDRYVDPDHLNLAVGDGGVLLLTDMASTNGTSIAGKRLSGDQRPYRFGEVISIGDTKLRIFDQNAGVEETALRSGWFLLADKFKRFPVLLLLTAIAIGVTALTNWMFSSEQVESNDTIVFTFSTLVLIVLFCLAMGSVSKLIRGEGNVRAFWIFACVALLVTNVADFLLKLVRFNLQDLNLGVWVSAGVYSVMGVCLLVGVLTYATHLGERQKWLFSLLIVVTVLGFAKSDSLLQEEHERWSDRSQTEQATMPPVFLWREDVTLDEYQRGSESLFDKASKG